MYKIRNPPTEYTEVVKNSRWLTTLVLAEIAGIASYRDMTGYESLSTSFTMAVLLLVISLAAFIISVLLARYERMILVKKLKELKKRWVT